VGAPGSTYSAASTSAVARTLAPSAAPPTDVAAADFTPAWTEHSAPNGMKYYYNSVTKESTYHKPDALKQSQQQQPASGAAPAAGAATSAATVAPAATAGGPSALGATASSSVFAAPAATQWREYMDASTGKPYYSDGVTTTWDKPPSLGSASSTGPGASGSGGAVKSVAGTAAKVEGASNAESTPPRRNKRRRDVDVEFGSKEEAVAAFKGMLLAKDVSPSLKWNDVAKICAGDARWDACEDALTVGERKQALAEYQTKRANDLREQERQERIRAKAAFTQMLSSMLPGMPGFSWWSSRFADVRDVLAKDDRFHAVAEEGTRESLFLDYCEECRKREERKKRSKRQDAHDSFVSFLKEKEDNGEISYASTWESFFASLADSEKADSRFIMLPERSNEDRQVYFADFVLELQAKEDDKRRRIREARQRAQQEQKDAFRGFLSQLAVQGKLLPSSRWRHVEAVVSSHPSFPPVKAQDPDLPRDVFEEFATAWNGRYLRDRTFLSQLVYPSAKSDVLVKADTTFDEFTQALLDRASEDPSKYESTKIIINRENPMSSARLYFNELSMRARGVPGPAFVRRGSASRRGHDTDSSEDEGEIIEDGELILE
jgi:pre-mRNA-processing factor 40